MHTHSPPPINSRSSFCANCLTLRSSTAWLAITPQPSSRSSEDEAGCCLLLPPGSPPRRHWPASNCSCFSGGGGGGGEGEENGTGASRVLLPLLAVAFKPASSTVPSALWLSSRSGLSSQKARALYLASSSFSSAWSGVRASPSLHRRRALRHGQLAGGHTTEAKPRLLLSLLQKRSIIIAPSFPKKRGGHSYYRIKANAMDLHHGRHKLVMFMEHPFCKAVLRVEPVSTHTRDTACGDTSKAFSHLSDD